MPIVIGILAYGSLIDNPGEEIASVTVEKVTGIRTPFGIEYARSSRRRGGAPTLVPVAEGGLHVEATLFRLDASVREATDILYRREINQVGSGKRYRPPTTNDPDLVRIGRLDGVKDYGPALYAYLSPNIDKVTADRLADLAIKSVQIAEVGRDGISYLINANAAGIVTPLSPAYERAILERLGASDLGHALELLKSQA